MMLVELQMTRCSQAVTLSSAYTRPMMFSVSTRQCHNCAFYCKGPLRKIKRHRSCVHRVAKTSKPLPNYQEIC